MTAQPSHRFSALGALALLMALSLTACATTSGDSASQRTPDPVLPTEQYPLQAQTQTKSINLRVNPNGLSDNQRLALDQVAAKANWINGEPMDVEIVTSSDPRAVSAGRMIGDYLAGHDVSSDSLSQVSAQAQPADIVTVNMVQYRTRIYDCNQTWENLSATRDNKPYKNFGCAVNANLAAQIHDPRDIDGPRPATSADATRKAVIVGKYQKGEVTSAAVDAAASGAISNAIK